MSKTQPPINQWQAAQQTAAQLFGALCALLSPLALITSVFGGIILADAYGAHLGQLQRMEKQGRVTAAVVDFPAPEYDWVFVNYTDGAEERSGVLEMRYYPPETWDLMQRGAEIQIRYLPLQARGSDRVTLEARFGDFRAYPAYFQPEALGLLICSWLVFLIKPQLLYVGFVDGETLTNEALNG